MLKLLDHAKQYAKDALGNVLKRAIADALTKQSQDKITRSAPRTSAQNIYLFIHYLFINLLFIYFKGTVCQVMHQLCG